MRTTFVISYAANLVLAIVSAAVLPARVASHFGVGGRPDGWMPRHANALFMAGLPTVIFLLLCGIPILLRAVPAHWVNLPNRTYWLAPERKAQTIVTLARRMQGFGAAIFLLLLAGGVLALRANLRTPVVLEERAFLACLALFLAYTAGWCVAFYRDFRVPKGDEE